MKKAVNTHEAKTQLSRWLKRVALGEEIIIAVRGKPEARLVPLKEEGAGRKFGTLKGRIEVPEDFDKPLPDEMLDAFEGNEKREMKLLLDTHVALWSSMGDLRLSLKTTELINSNDAEGFFSSVSTWEMAIRYALGDLLLRREPAKLVSQPSQPALTACSSLRLVRKE